MAEKKNQHYVPQLLLRKFSRDDRSVRLLLLSNGTIVEEASIKAQCSKPYFYGRDLIAENYFAESETRVGSLLAELSAEAFESLTVDQLEELKVFAYFLRVRTKASAEQGRQGAKGLMEELADLTCEANGFESGLVSFEMQLSPLLSLIGAAPMAPIVSDLAVAFVRNRQRIPFLFSDHPVVAYNRLAEVTPELRALCGRTGMATRGLQLFLPLSPEWCFAAYDAGAYQYGKRGSRVVNASLQDVRTLNRMQAVEASQTLYLSPSLVDESHLEDCRRVRSRHPPLRVPSTRRVPPVGRPRPEPGEPPNDLIMQNYPDLSLDAGLSFVRVVDNTSYSGYSQPVPPYRNPRLYQRLRKEADAAARRLS